MRKIKLSEDAYLDIEEMFSYISYDNKNAARKMRNKIYGAIKGLDDFPFKYPAIPKEFVGTQKGCYRYIVIKPYIIFYKVLDDIIVIARVVHTKQNWLYTLFGGESR